MAYVKSSLIPQGILDMIAINNAEEGAICSFNTDLNMGLYECICQINATGGGGTPSTPIPIVGISSLEITRCGINQWDEQTERGNIDTTTGENTPYNYMLRSVNYIKVSPNTTLYTPVSWLQCYFYGANKQYISYQAFAAHTINVPNNAEYMRFRLSSDYGTTYNNDISINYPATDTSYHAYNGQTFTIDLGGTRYGCYVDAVRGKLVVTHAIVDLGTLSWSNTSSGGTAVNAWARSATIGSQIKKPTDNNSTVGCVCSVFTEKSANAVYLGNNNCVGINTSGDVTIYATEFTDYTDVQITSALSGQMLVYPLATPIEIDVSAISVEAVSGVNNVFHDGNGTTKCKFFETVGHNVLK